MNEENGSIWGGVENPPEYLRFSKENDETKEIIFLNNGENEKDSYNQDVMSFKVIEDSIEKIWSIRKVSKLAVSLRELFKGENPENKSVKVIKTGTGLKTHYSLELIK